MALHNLKITVIDGGKASGGMFGDDSETETTSKKSGKNSPLYKVLNFNQTLMNKVKQKTSPTTFFAIQAGIGAATQTARQFINYYVSDIGRSSGDSNYHAIINRRIEVGTDIASIFGATFSGAASGAMFGLPGALIGSVVGAASSSINLGFKYAERGREYAHEMFKENNSQAYNLARAGNIALTGRLR